MVRSVFNVVGSLFNKNSDASPVPYAAPGRYVIPALSGRSDNEVYMRTMGTAGTIFQIVSLLAGASATPQWRLYRKPKTDGRQRYTTGDRGSDQRTEVLQHLALNVWNNPNPFNTGTVFREAGWQHMELTGEQWWVVTRDPRATFPTGLWLVRPDRMEPIPSADKYIAGYVYTGPSGERVPLMPDEVILTKYPNPLDPYRGLGPVQSVLVDIDAMKYGSEWNRNFFINGAVPGGIVTVPGNMNDDDFDTFTNRWREAHQGVARAHRVAILEGGATWVPTQMSVKDMDFSNLRNVSRDVLREAWGIHKSMLGNSDEVNRANATTAEEVFGRWKIIPRLDRQRDVLNNQFLPMFGSTGEGVEFDYINPLPDDREADNAELTAKTTAYAALVTAGVEPDDAAEVVGLPPMRHVTQVPAITSAPGAAELEQAGNSNGEPAEDDNPFENRARKLAASCALTAVATAAGSNAPDQPAPGPNQPDLSRVDQQWKTATDNVANDYQNQILPAQQQQLQQQIREHVDAAELSALGALTVDTAAAKALLLAAMVAFAAVAAREASRETDAQGADVPPQVPAAGELEAIAAVTVALMASELAVSAGREAMRIAVPGVGGQQVADQVGQFLQDLSDAGLRGHLAGAMSAAQNRARHATFTQPGAPRGSLVATEVLDKATCDRCEEINGTVFGDTDDPAAVAEAFAAYPMGGYTLCEGRDRCRGTLFVDYGDTADATPDNPGGDMAAMLKKLVNLLEPEPAHINGHHHEKART